VDRTELDQALLQAHARVDKQALVSLYRQAGDAAEREGDINAACFFLTHAFVFALEIGSPDAECLNRRLVEKGRATLLSF